MLALPPQIKELFYRTIAGEVSLPDFEQWLYTHEKIERLLQADDYLDLLTLSYHKSGAKYELSKLLRKHIDLGDFETYKLLNLLQEAIQKNFRLPLVLIQFYNLYCKGYGFLQDLGMNYGLAVEVPRVENTLADSWEELTNQQQADVLASFSPVLERELNRVIRWLEDKVIILTGEQDEMGYYVYKDYRAAIDWE